MKQEYGKWVGAVETFQVEEVGESLVWEVGGPKVTLAGSGARCTWVLVPALALYRCGNLSLHFFKMRLIIIEISSKMLRITYNNIYQGLSAGLTRKWSTTVSSEHRVGCDQREMDCRALVSCRRDRGTESRL